MTFKLTTFEQNTLADSGALSGYFLWSDPSNWTNGIPVSGDSVTAAGVGYDDIPGLSLTNATLDMGGSDVSATTALRAISMDLATDAIAGTGAEYGTIGAGVTFLDQSPNDLANTYLAENGGTVVLAAAPAATSA